MSTLTATVSEDLDLHLKNDEFQPCTKTVLQLLEEVVQTYPHHEAIISDDIKLSYEELYHQSYVFAKRLLSLGVKPGDSVGLSMDISFEFITSLLGIMLAGGVYLPLDPNYPVQRLKHMCNSTEVKWLVVDRKHSNSLPFFKEKKICVEDNKPFSLGNIKENLKLPSLTPNCRSYIIFTSGSTGKPKGVPTKHVGLANAVCGRMKYYEKPIKTVLLGSISFDMSLMTIFHCLISAGTLVMQKKLINLDPSCLHDCIVRHSVNYLLCVPSLYELLLQKSTSIPTLKYVVLAGESFQNSLVEMHRKINPETYLFNEYGLTECSICSTVGLIYDPTSKVTNLITIGKPIKNTKIFIIDEHKKILPDGELGEICIYGVGLTEGYLNNKTANKQKFISIRNSNGKKISPIYRTGDYGKILPSGDIEYHGRIDRQIKLRGYRIELEGIEQMLSRHSAIQKTVVELQPNTYGENHLVAYYKSRKPIDETSLRTSVKKILPKYMTPSRFIHVKEFPLTPNGKIDKDALKRINSSSNETKKYTRSELEKSLLDIWKRVLDKADVKLTENFFDIGGDSFLIAVMQTAIHKEAGIEVAITEFFKYPTIAKLAKRLECRLVGKNLVNNKIIQYPQKFCSLKQKPSFRALRKVN